MPLYMKMSQNINKTMRHLKFCYISIYFNIFQLKSSNWFPQNVRH